MDQEKIGKLIKKIRKQNNLTQSELAKRYGVTYQAVSKWENGKNIPDVSLIKQMSKDFNIDIEDILEGNLNKKKNKKILIITVLLITMLTIFLILNRQNTFSFKTLSSQCTSFNITGSIAYNNKKSSIYISNIDYCGREDNTEYREIECVLYEVNNGNDVIIAKNKYSKNESITLDSFLKTLNFKIDDYNRTCKKYTKNSLYLKINAKDLEGQIKSHIIPLSLEDNC